MALPLLPDENDGKMTSSERYFLWLVALQRTDPDGVPAWKIIGAAKALLDESFAIFEARQRRPESKSLATCKRCADTLASLAEVQAKHDTLLQRLVLEYDSAGCNTLLHHVLARIINDGKVAPTVQGTEHEAFNQESAGLVWRSQHSEKQVDGRLVYHTGSEPPYRMLYLDKREIRLTVPEWDAIKQVVKSNCDMATHEEHKALKSKVERAIQALAHAGAVHGITGYDVIKEARRILEGK